MSTENANATARVKEKLIRETLQGAGVDPAVLRDLLLEWRDREADRKAKFDAVAVLDGKIQQLRDQLDAQIREVMRQAEFRKLEATWTGLNRLVSKTEHSDQLIVEVMD